MSRIRTLKQLAKESYIQSLFNLFDCGFDITDAIGLVRNTHTQWLKERIEEERTGVSHD